MKNLSILWKKCKIYKILCQKVSKLSKCQKCRVCQKCTSDTPPHPEVVTQNWQKIDKKWQKIDKKMTKKWQKNDKKWQNWQKCRVLGGPGGGPEGGFWPNLCPGRLPGQFSEWVLVHNFLSKSGCMCQKSEKMTKNWQKMTKKWQKIDKKMTKKWQKMTKKTTIIRHHPVFTQKLDIFDSKVGQKSDKNDTFYDTSKNTSGRGGVPEGGVPPPFFGDPMYSFPLLQSRGGVPPLKTTKKGVFRRVKKPKMMGVYRKKVTFCTFLKVPPSPDWKRVVLERGRPVFHQKPQKGGFPGGGQKHPKMTLFWSKKPLSCPLRGVFGPPKKVVKKPPRADRCGQQVGGIELNWGGFRGNSAKTRGTFSHGLNVPLSHSGDIRYRLGMYQIRGGIFDTFCFWVVWHKIFMLYIFFCQKYSFCVKVEKDEIYVQFQLFQRMIFVSKV